MTPIPALSAAGIAAVPDAASIEAAANSFDSVGSALSTAMDTLDAIWSTLRAPGVYETPESAHVHDAMQGPRRATDVIAQDAASTRRALEAYAGTLARLSTRRAALLQDIVAADEAAAAAAADPAADPQGDDVAARGLPDRISAFNADVAAADGDCAAALRALARYPQQQLGTLSDALGDDLAAGGALGVAGALMSNYDDLKDALVAELQVRGLAEAAGEHKAPQSVTGEAGQEARGRVTPAPMPDQEPGSRHVAGPKDLEGVSKGMRWGGKALGAVGTVATIGGAYIDSYNENSAAHPEWTETHKNLKATEHAVVTGGVSAAGGIAGGLAGAQIGASIGTIVLPGAGTVVCGIIGGLVGGFIGSNIGEKMGEGAERLMDDLFHW